MEKPWSENVDLFMFQSRAAFKAPCIPVKYKRDKRYTDSLAFSFIKNATHIKPCKVSLPSLIESNSGEDNSGDVVEIISKYIRQ